MKVNRFTRAIGKRTLYNLTEGDALINRRLYIVAPVHVKKGSPDFSLIENGKHLSSFYKNANGIYSGDIGGCLWLIILSKDWEVFDLIQTSYPVYQGRGILMNDPTRIVKEIGMAKKKLTLV